jgi:hypothetical protein
MLFLHKQKELRCRLLQTLRRDSVGNTERIRSNSYTLQEDHCKLETLLIIAKNVEILSEENLNEIMVLWQKAIQLLNGFINYYEKAELK